MKRVILGSTAVAAVTLVSSSVFAQAAPAPGVQATATATAVPDTSVAVPGPQAAAVPGDSDHDMMVGSFAVGYLGRRSIPYGSGTLLGETPTAGRAETQAPVIGARYWLSPLLGLEAGFGFAMLGDGKVKDEAPGLSVEADLAPVTAFMFHAALPLALSNTGHFSFQVIPEANVGFAFQTVEAVSPGGTGGTEDKGSGLVLDIGARGGAEVHFGFIGIPQLSLQGSIGLLYRLEQWKLDSSDGTGTFTHTDTRGSLSTTVYDNPWNIFTSNVAALYYF